MAKQIKTYFLADGLPGFTLPAMFFSVGDVFFTDFSFEVFLSNLPLLPFTSIFAPFSEPHQAVIFVLGAKGNSGIVRESKVKPPVFWKNLQPFG
ncbi:hypothetical protein NXV47_18720 [Bacteroides uniformis]|nr:hypothetical protein [Bacteroides uniformis]